MGGIIIDMRVKYIKAKGNQIVVFSSLLNHSAFKHFQPISAGFISIGADAKHAPTIQCYGYSITLGIKSDPEVDTILARQQILGYRV